MTEQPTRYTISKAARALDCSARTLRRAIKEGDLSATKERRGKREVWIIDAAELVRYADNTGRTLTLGDTSQVADESDNGLDGTHVLTTSGAPPDSPREDAAGDAATVDTGGALATEVDRLQGALAAVTAERDRLCQDRDWLRARIEAAERDRERAQRMVERLLPPAQPTQPGWLRQKWAWFTGRSRQQSDDHDET